MPAWCMGFFRMASVPSSSSWGVATRPAAVLNLISLLTAFFLVHHAAFSKDGHVELVWLYIVVFAALIFPGAGRISIDARFKR
jgi:uncharacterized membrane protein YphA (DoxX/SURF4 family)